MASFYYYASKLNWSEWSKYCKSGGEADERGSDERRRGKDWNWCRPLNINGNDIPYSDWWRHARTSPILTRRGAEAIVECHSNAMYRMAAMREQSHTADAAFCRTNVRMWEKEIKAGNEPEEKIDDCRSTGYERPTFIRHIQWKPINNRRRTEINWKSAFWITSEYNEYAIKTD